MVRQPAGFGFMAEYPGDGPVFDEFEKYLATELEKLPPDWEASFGRMNRMDPARHVWNYQFLLKGDVPQARTRREAETKAKDLVHRLGTGMRLAHPNPGSELPEPLVSVWRW